MSIFVLDASVVIKWFLPEDDSAAALRLLDTADDHVVPDLLFAETTNVIWKRVKHGQLDPRRAPELVADVASIHVDVVPSRSLAEDGYALVHTIGRTVYDAMYLALAIRLDTRLITADARLHRALAATPALARHVQSL